MTNSSDHNQEPVSTSQLRSFGLIVGFGFAVIALWPLLFGRHYHLWASVLSGSLIVVALIFPPILRPVYTVWMAFGQVMGAINSRILLGIVYYFLFTPISLIRKMGKKGPLLLDFNKDATTYRIKRDPRESSHMDRQF